MVKFTTEQGTIEFETIEDFNAFQKEMTPPTQVKLEINCPDDIETHIEESLKGHYLQDQVYLDNEDARVFTEAMKTSVGSEEWTRNACQELFEDNVNMDEMLTEVFGEGYTDQDFTCPCCAEMEEDEPETEYNLRLTESEMLRLWTLLGFVAKDNACYSISAKLEDMLQHVDEELLDNSEAVVLVSEENPILDGTPLVALGEHVIFTD